VEWHRQLWQWSIVWLLFSYIASRRIPGQSIYGEVVKIKKKQVIKHLGVLRIFILYLLVKAEQFPNGGMPSRFHQTGSDCPVYSSQISDGKELGPKEK